MPLSTASIDSKPIRDVDNRFVGRVVGTERNAVTHEPSHLLVQLDPGLSGSGGAESDRLWIPYGEIASIRRDSIQLAGSIDRLLSEADRPPGDLDHALETRERDTVRPPA